MAQIPYQIFFLYRDRRANNFLQNDPIDKNCSIHPQLYLFLVVFATSWLNWRPYLLLFYMGVLLQLKIIFAKSFWLASLLYLSNFQSLDQDCHIKIICYNNSNIIADILFCCDCHFELFDEELYLGKYRVDIHFKTLRFIDFCVVKYLWRMKYTTIQLTWKNFNSSFSQMILKSCLSMVLI